MRALGRLLWRGGVTVGICAVTAFCLAGFLSLVATSLLPQSSRSPRWPLTDACPVTAMQRAEADGSRRAGS